MVKEIETSAPQKTYILENLGCANCAAKMEKKIKALPEVEDAVIVYATKQLRVASEEGVKLLPKLQEICASFESEVVVVEKKSRNQKNEEQKKAEEKETRKTIAAIVVGAVAFVLGFILEENYVLAATAVRVLAYIVLGGKIVWTALKNIIKGKVFDENFLMSVATLAAFAIGDFAEATGVMLFYRVGELFEDIAVSKSRSQIMDAVDLRPEVVQLVEGENVTEIPAEDAVVGNVVLVRPGDRIPLDGVIVEGESRIDTSAVTGEPVPVRAAEGDSVISGCVNTSGVLKIKVTNGLEDSMVTRILNSVENAAASKPQIDRFITKFARVYTPFVVGLAVLTAVVPSLITGNWNYWLYTAITFLVISCPCALVLSVPLAFFSGIGAGSKRGILFKGGVALEALQKVKAVVMDKTGTITEGNFVVQEVVAEGTFDETELLKMTAVCEKTSTHPIANSIVAEARNRELELEEQVAEMQEIAGKGIRAVVGGKEVLCGNRMLMELHQIDLSKYTKAHYGTEVLVAVNGAFAGHIVIADTIKEEAGSAISAIKKQGIVTAMLTGDSENSAREVAAETGVQEVHAGLLPENKVEELQKIRETHGSVMFVGDGINDAPVLAGADIGAAMGSGADAAIEAADVVFMTSSMEAIPESIAIAKATANIAMQNVVIALVFKAAIMVLGLFGYANMWMAVFADTGVAMICILNSIRILYRK